MGVTIHRLSNGMTVYLSTDRQQPRFTAWIAVRAGSRNDPADSTGLAHYLEHMLFKGTRRLGTLGLRGREAAPRSRRGALRELRQDRRGGARARSSREIDAETQKIATYAIPNEMRPALRRARRRRAQRVHRREQTVYIADVPANRLEQWAAIEGERFAEPGVPAVPARAGGGLRGEEPRAGQPERPGLRGAAGARCIPTHPYGTQTTIGTVEHLKTPAYRDMVGVLRALVRAEQHRDRPGRRHRRRARPARPRARVRPAEAAPRRAARPGKLPPCAAAVVPWWRPRASRRSCSAGRPCRPRTPDGPRSR